MNTGDIISISGLRKSFAQNASAPVLDIEELNVRRGEFLCIVGQSGCGKSTLLNLISGFIEPDEGRIEFLREGVEERPRSVQLFQDYGLFPWLSVRNNVAFGLRMAGQYAYLSRNHTGSEFNADGGEPAAAEQSRRHQRRTFDALLLSMGETLPRSLRAALHRRALANRRIDDAIELVGLTESSNLLPHQLSGGMKQRCAIARALVLDPDVILMDEPLGALDPFTRLRIQKEIERIWQTTGKTVIWVTHNIDEAVALADRIVVLGKAPDSVASIHPLPHARPRDLADPILAKLKKSIITEISDDLVEAMQISGS